MERVFQDPKHFLIDRLTRLAAKNEEVLSRLREKADFVSAINNENYAQALDILLSSENDLIPPTPALTMDNFQNFLRYLKENSKANEVKAYFHNVSITEHDAHVVAYIALVYDTSSLKLNEEAIDELRQRTYNYTELLRRSLQIKEKDEKEVVKRVLEWLGYSNLFTEDAELSGWKIEGMLDIIASNPKKIVFLVRIIAHITYTPETTEEEKPVPEEVEEETAETKEEEVPEEAEEEKATETVEESPESEEATPPEEAAPEETSAEEETSEEEAEEEAPEEATETEETAPEEAAPEETPTEGETAPEETPAEPSIFGQGILAALQQPNVGLYTVVKEIGEEHALDFLDALQSAESPYQALCWAAGVYAPEDIGLKEQDITSLLDKMADAIEAEGIPEKEVTLNWQNTLESIRKYLASVEEKEFTEETGGDEFFQTISVTFKEPFPTDEKEAFYAYVKKAGVPLIDHVNAQVKGIGVITDVRYDTTMHQLLLDVAVVKKS